MVHSRAYAFRVLRSIAFVTIATMAAAPVASAASISGTVFNDVNGNGVRDAGEPGLGARTVNLDMNADGSVDASTLTSGAGTYSFLGLAAGTYRVREVGQAGTVQTTANPADLVLGAATDATGVDFGNFFLITISGSKFNDVNGNGVLNAGEPGLPGVTIQLDAGANGSVDNTALTDVSGNFSFANLGPGTYRVREVVPVGSVQTTTNPADITASSGTNVSGVDFGNVVVPGAVPMLDARILVGLAIALAAIALRAIRA